MLMNYITIAFRNLRRFTVFTSINVIGLAVGMACTVLILLWVEDELSYDTCFRNADDIYLVLRGDNEGMTALTSKLLAPSLRQEIPEVANATNLFRLPESMSLFFRSGDKVFEENAALADSNFLGVFSLKLIDGDRATALQGPRSVVLTEATARKYFGDEHAVGKSLRLSAFGREFPMQVTAVLADPPHNSSIQCRVILPLAWLESLGIKDYGWQNQSVQTFIQVRSNPGGEADISGLSSRIRACELRHDSNQPQSLQYSLLPLERSHLYGNGIKFLASTGDIAYVRLFSAIALIILLIASINYMNLTTALGLRRTKEIGIKKALGASRRTLVVQFLLESLVLSFAAMAIAALIVELFLPEFNRLSGKNLAVGYSNPYSVLLMLAVAVIAGLVSGSYPALFLSSFAPVQVLRGRGKLGRGSPVTRTGLVVFQFAVSIAMIICTITIFNQLAFIRNSNLGFDRENIVCIAVTGEANRKYEGLKAELQSSPDILGVSRSESMNTRGWSSTMSVNWQGKRANEGKLFWVFCADYDMAATYRIEMSQGRFFSRQFPSDGSDAFVVNEAAARAMEMQSPLNQGIDLSLIGKRQGRIIGVTKDFHFASFRSAVEPLIILIPGAGEEDLFYRTISVRLRPGFLREGMASVEKAWKQHMGDIPFSYYFFDESLRAEYSAEQRMESMFAYFSVLSIVIASLGLFGLASFSAEQRTKEVGIRKVLGASVTGITMTLSKEFLAWVIVSNVIAWPVALYAMKTWLQGFAYRVEISVWIFVVAGLVALGVALLTVASRAVRVALANPVESLRYE